MTSELSWFPVVHDHIASERGTDEFLVWQASILRYESVKLLESFVTNESGNQGRAKFVTATDGSYNMLLRFNFPDDMHQQVVLRFPKPGHTVAALVEEMLENEVSWMQYLAEHHKIKVPHIYSWGTQGPGGFGPYILMDFVEGENLLMCLRKWAKSDSPDDTKKRNSVYEQVAEMYLQLDRPKFDRIGSITKTPEGEWAVTKRPLTLDMHQQALYVPGFPIDTWPSGPLSRSRDYKALVVDLHSQQLEFVRNLNIPLEMDKTKWRYMLQEGSDIDFGLAMRVAQARYIARKAFAMPAAASYLDEDDNGPFTIFADLHPYNMIVCPETAEIKAVFGIELMNTMPAVFSHDPPLWLRLVALETILDRGYFLWWERESEPLLEEFLAVMKRVEDRQAQKRTGQPLSSLMRTSWDTRKYLINLAMHNTDCVDSIYWACPELFPKPDDGPEMEKEVQKFQAHTKNQIAAYEKERAAKSGPGREEAVSSS